MQCGGVPAWALSASARPHSMLPAKHELHRGAMSWRAHYIMGHTCTLTAHVAQDDRVLTECVTAAAEYTFAVSW